MFYNFDLNIYNEVTTTNELYVTSTEYILDKNIKCDIQPSSQTILKKTFGELIESLYLIFADEDLELGTVVEFKGCKYRINQKVDWIDYFIYSVEGV